MSKLKENISGVSNEISCHWILYRAGFKREKKEMEDQQGDADGRHGTGNGYPHRSYLHGEGEKDTTWNLGAPPNYDVVDRFFHQGRTKVWPAGSLEEKVQNLVKTWEMELFHKTSPQDYKSLDPNNYTFSLNGREPITLEEVQRMGGGYNAFLQTLMPEKMRVYNPAEETAESSHLAFKTTFPRGFALEVLEVYSGPPVIVYKFRHWGYMEGPFKGHAPTGELVELVGISIFQVGENMKIVKVEFFFDPGELIGGLIKGSKGSNDGAQSVTPACHILRSPG